MNSVVLIGYGPDPLKSLERSAFSLRTWMFEKALLDSGFEVEKILFSKSNHNGCLNINSASDRKIALKKVKQSNSLVVIGSGFDICKMICKWNLKNKYVVSDLNGWTASEIQARSFFDDSNVLVDRFCKVEKEILLGSDFVTTVSTAQKFAILGELNILGKLTKETFLHSNVSAVANKGLSFDLSGMEAKDSDKFKILWLGGFNNWADEQTLFEGISLLMDRFDFVELTVTGGTIRGVNDKKFENFKQLVENSKHADKFKLLNWAKASLIPQIISESHLGLNCDLDCVETWTGARNRINEMIANGLPVVSSRGSEVAAELETHKIGALFESGNPRDLAFVIELAINGQWKIWKQNAKNFEYSFDDFEEMLKYCLNPFANRIKKTNLLEKLVWYMRNKSLKDVLRKLGF